ncbi:hypothetical protein J3459_014239 [Metarhizium acridum]|uniref:UPF0052 domain protein n=1 Tax=Metarhizium acridum (strain CQMa 102) TaxID=655827 RepID=E9E903_METAQ|nr:UPF0052 domain protein [Metarhizium acridum CQMa 102]EFY87639.1 UPF0052 domain protein [Metarhizium acridum CQMa 102]KAG8414578.1 hypothetical protein J3459_014239 [Metarhizium acridum]
MPSNHSSMAPKPNPPGILQPPASAPDASTSTSTTRTGIVVFSGGSAANSLVDVFERVREANQTSLSYVIPISDNGGSTSEIIRVFGGPGIGDVRSRLVRLIPDNDAPETVAIKHLFNYRLAKTYEAARAEWFEILDATHGLWTDVSSPKRELIRAYLNSFNLEVIKRMRPSSRFDFSKASIGNLFLTGARLFTGSFEAAIYLLSSVCAVPDTISVLPALNTNFAHHIAAGLQDGTVITGQNDISHPSYPTAAVPGAGAAASSTGVQTPALSVGHDTEEHDKIEDANLPGSLPALRRQAIAFSKDDDEDLPSRIDRIWYINPYGQEIRIPANPRVLDAINTAGTVVYCIGSLFTSLIPNLVLRGVGEAIASPAIKNKILILNGTTDRETGPSDNPLTALDFVAAIANACADSRGWRRPSEDEYNLYVTHLVHLEGPASPKVDKHKFGQLGIDTIRLYGPKDEFGRGGRYDATALGQTLETVVGRKDIRMDRSRRNTLVG